MYKTAQLNALFEQLEKAISHDSSGWISEGVMYYFCH